MAGEIHGGARQPVWSDVSALGEGECVFKVDTQIADGALDLSSPRKI
jgi:hypothetical protein